jgi:hypothetical protein
MDILESSEVKLSAVKGENVGKVDRKFQVVLKRNPGFALLWQYTKCSTEKILTLVWTSLPENFIC